MNQVNPLLSQARRYSFDAIEPKHVVPAVRTLVDSAQVAVDRLKRQTGPLTWQTTLAALEDATVDLEQAWLVVEHLLSVNHSAALAEAHAEAQALVSAFSSSIPVDAELYAVIMRYAQADEARHLTGGRRRFLDKTLDTFRRSGADLNDADKARYQAIVAELNQLGTRFASHVLTQTADWELIVTDPARVAGLPQSALDVAQAGAPGPGTWRFTLQVPTVNAVLSHAEDRSLRETIWRAYHSRCIEGEHDNRPLIDRMLALRREQATMLGFADFSDYILADRMAGSGAVAKAFLDDLEARCQPAAAAEHAELVAFARNLGVDELAPWDLGFYAEKQRQALYAFDDEVLRPYFPFEGVLHGLFEVAHRLYGVKVTPSDLPVWHPSVRSYALQDDRGRTVGQFYTDFVPRPQKRPGAWMNPILTGGPDASGFVQGHVGVICGNFTPPIGDAPALLTHREVQTLFHEFGHLLHHLLTEVPIRSQAGSNVAWDFVELPSQIMENWCWEREGLDLVGRHWQTGERIPDELFERMTRARNFRSASRILRQLSFGQVDLALHRAYDPTSQSDAVAWAAPIYARYQAVPVPDDSSILPSFMHLFAGAVGYAAAYYSYLWAGVLDADAFTRFQTAGLFDPKTGQAFRTHVLARGDSEDPAVLFRAFQGRDPDPTALLRREGLAA